MTTETKDGQAEEFLSGKLEQVNVVGIERELRSLWESAVSSKEGKCNVVRACALNLVLYSTRAGEENYLSNLLADIATNHPCRALLALSLSSEKPNIEAWVTARCHLDNEEKSKQICCEQITVRSEGPGRHKLSSAVLPLMLPDLPVILFWHAPALEKLDLAPFLDAADMLIVDTQMLNDGQNVFFELCQLSEKAKKNLVLADINWSRLTAWRKLTATLFEEWPLSLPDLTKIKQVDLSYSLPGKEQDHGAASQALLFLGWLAGRLNWRIKSAKNKEGEGFSFQMEAQDRDIEATITGVPSDVVPCGNLISAKLVLSSKETATINLEYHQSGSFLAVTFEDGNKKEKRATAFKPTFDTTDLIGQELEVIEHDPVLSQALSFAAELNQLLR